MRNVSTNTKILRLTKLRDLEIPLPPAETQEQIANLFLATEKVKETTLAALKKRERMTEIALLKLLGDN